MSPGPWVLSLLLQGPGTSSTDIRARDGWNGRMRGGLPDGGTVNWSGHRGTQAGAGQRHSPGFQLRLLSGQPGQPGQGLATHYLLGDDAGDHQRSPGYREDIDDGLKNRMLEKKNCQNHLFSVQNASDLIFF